MMKRLLLYCAALFACGLAFTPSGQGAAKPWRVALIVGGPYSTYQTVLQGLAEGLAERGLIANGGVPRPEGDESLAPMWKWLAENAGGDRLRFAADAFYSPEWDPDRRGEVKKALLERLRGQGDIDCVLAFGTWGGQDIEPSLIPALVLAATNAVEAGIVTSPDDSGRDNLLAAVEPDKYKRQVLIFHKIIGFSKLGLTYEDTPSGRGIAALGEIEAAAGEAGVELVRCTKVKAFDRGGPESAANLLRACHEDLVKQGAEAVYLTYNQGLGGKYAAPALEPLIRADLPTFAQQGSDLVKRGALLSIAGDNIKEEGLFAAEALEKIMGGRQPRSLPQRYESSLGLAVNLRTAARIGWSLPIEILAAVDEFYRGY